MEREVAMFTRHDRWTTGGCIDFGLAWSPDGTTLATAGTASCIRRFKLEPSLHGPVQHVYQNNLPLDWIGWTTDNDYVVGYTASHDRVWLWSNNETMWPNKPRRELSHDNASITCAALSPDGRYLATGASGDAVPYSLFETTPDHLLPKPVVRIWDLATNAPARRLSEEMDLVTAVTWVSPQHIAIARKATGAPIFVLDARSGRTEARLEGHHGVITELAISSQTPTMLAAAAERCVFVYDLRTNRLCHHLELHDAPITSLALSDDSTTLVTGSQDGSIAITALGDDECYLTQRLFGAHDHRPIRRVVWRPGHRSFASSGNDARVCMWTEQAA